MPSVSQQAGGTRSPCQKEREKWLIGLESVARRTSEHEVVTPVVRGLALARRDVIHGDRVRTHAPLAISADGPVLLEEPLARIHVRVAARRQRRVLMRGPAPGTLSSLGRPSSSGWTQGGRVYSILSPEPRQGQCVR